MKHLSRFIPSRAKQTAYSSPFPPIEDAGLPTKSGLVAGIKCETSDLVDCTTKCNGDLRCIQKCGQDCK